MIKTATFYNAHPVLQNKESYVKSSTLYIGHYGNVFLLTQMICCLAQA
jgi:hypothetical protein